MVPLSLLVLLAYVAAVAAAPDARAAEPTVTIQNGTVIGSSSGGVDSFRGIPYAIPPTGTRRLRPPTALATGFGTFRATGFPAACPQMLPGAINTTDLPPQTVDLLFKGPFGQGELPFMSEDCLTINVQRPSNIESGTKLPVVYWIYGGGFSYGFTALFDGTSFVQKSVSLNAPVIWVAVNYRVAGFGFLASKELQGDGSTNLGLRDQRLGLQWVAENIGAFGGDPNRGQSAGSISVFDQLLINRGNNNYKGKPLFIGAIMSSGTVLPATDVATAKPQAIYDTVVSTAGCSSAPDTLRCLRSLPYLQFYNAQNSVPAIISVRGVELSYLPRYDPSSDFFPSSPSDVGPTTPIVVVPSIVGDQEDEGAAFAIPLFKTQNTEALIQFLSYLFPIASRSELLEFINTYPVDPSAGCPYRTGPFNELYPGFKRNGAILGDVLTLARRLVLNFSKQFYPNNPVWSYLSSHGYGIPFVGSFHGGDIIELLFGLPYPEPQLAYQTYFISFINYQDPNKISTSFPLIPWPQWQIESPRLLNLLQFSNQILLDDFRAASYNVILRLRNVLKL